MSVRRIDRIVVKEKKIRVLLVGAGQMGAGYHYPVLKAAQNVEIVGAVRNAPESILEGIQIYPSSSLNDVLTIQKPDLVIVATPHYLHYQQVKLSLDHDCHVLVEKPLSFEYKEAQELVALAENKQKLLVVNLQRRYEAAAISCQNLIKENKIGQPRLIHGLFAHQFKKAMAAKNLWRLNLERGGAGIIDDSAFHLIDLLIYFAGSQIIEKHFCSNFIQKEGGTPHTFSCLFQTENGISVSGSGSYLSPLNSVQEEISVIGEKGSLFIRRFLLERNTNPPNVFFKSFDGEETEQFNLLDRPSGRNLTLINVLDFLAGKSNRDSILTEGKDVLETHRAISLIKRGTIVR